MSQIETRYGKFNIIDHDNTISVSLREYGEWAQCEIDFLNLFIGVGSVVVDAGAFIGTHTRAFSEQVGLSGKVLSFEPRGVTFEVLLSNSILSSIQNIEAFNFALGARESLVVIPKLDLTTSTNFGALSLELPSLVVNQGEEIKIVPLDNLNLRKLDFLKIDVEGMELAVLDGASKTIDLCQPLIFAECNSLQDSARILDWCCEHKFRIYGVLSPAFNQNNFCNNDSNRFGNFQETGLLLIPNNSVSRYFQIISQTKIPEIKSIDDLALLLLNKPQYIPEVLSKTNSAKLLSLDFQSPYSSQLESEILESKNSEKKINAELIEFKQHSVQMEIVLADIYASSSWRVTAPLRKVSESIKGFSKVYSVYKRYRQVYPGFFGLIKIFSMSYIFVNRNGMLGFVGKLKSLNRQGFAQSVVRLSENHHVINLKDMSEFKGDKITDIAVHLHAFYPDIALTMVPYLDNIPGGIFLYVTTDSQQKADQLLAYFSGLKNIVSIEVLVTENRGRDILPMLVVLGSKLAQHELVLHIHTKTSPHDAILLSGWRRYLLESLLGNKMRVMAIINYFAEDNKLGIFFPSYFDPVKRHIFLSNKFTESFIDKPIKKLLSRFGKSEKEFSEIDKTFFPAGNMFWFRGKAIKPFVEMKLNAEDFESEKGQINNTLAHAIERLFPYFADQVGLTTKAYLAESFFSRDCTAHKFGLIHQYLQDGLIVKPTIVFDHNGGGGTNIYTNHIFRSAFRNGGSVLRIYFYDGNWFLSWLKSDDGMLFYTESIEDLFSFLEKSNSIEIIINSFYGAPNIKILAEKVIRLKKELNVILDFKVHDFLALCSSPHLMDNNEKYCGVPKNPDVCRNCLKENRGWYHHWYPKANIPSDILDWRKPFDDLFSAADVIEFFDSSSIEIIKKGFAVDSKKIKVTPHTIEYFPFQQPASLLGPLHIGILGTLSKVKGSHVLDLISEYNNKLPNPSVITVVGSSVVNIPKGVQFHGSYEQRDLPKIIDYYGINVILMLSIVPETFSYTISEAMHMGLPIVCFDLGAQGNRILNYPLGKVVPLDSSPEVIMSAAQAVLKKAQEMRK